MSRVYNFSAGPAVLPEEVLKEVAEEMMDYQGTGMSVMEMSHRSADFQKIIDEAEQDLRDLMKIPDNYKVLFLQGCTKGRSINTYIRANCRAELTHTCFLQKKPVQEKSQIWQYKCHVETVCTERKDSTISKKKCLYQQSNGN